MDVVFDEKIKTCCFFRCTKRQRYILWTVLMLPIVFLVCLIIGITIRAAVEEQRFQRIILDPNPSFINSNQSVIWQRAKTLGQAIKFNTISYNQTYQITEEIEKIHKFISNEYPHIHSASFIKKEIINDHSIVFRVEGTDPTNRIYMLCAHLDVVPEGDLSKWDCDPFLGEIVKDHECSSVEENIDNANAYIFGRGAIDDKHSVFGILEALEHIVKSGEQPKRSFYVAFGHDEEVSGNSGAGHIKEYLEKELKQKGETLDFIVDEGNSVYQDVVPGVDIPVAMIGVTEKGWATLSMKVEGKQTHSSMPPKESAIGIMSNAIAKLEKNHQPSRFGKGPEYDTAAYSAYYASFGFKMALSNLWLFSPVVSAIMASDAATDATQRTTTAITVVEAGFKENVVPGEASFIVNHRMHTADNIDKVLETDRKTIDDDRVKINVTNFFNPPKISPYSSETIPFQVVANSALDVYGDVGVVPGLLVGNTDTIHYIDLSENVYRFSPAFLLPEDIDRFHGINERISVKNYNQVVEFYYRIMKNADKALDVEKNLRNVKRRKTEI